MKTGIKKSQIQGKFGCAGKKQAKPANPLKESQALVKLREIKQAFARYIGRTFGHLAADCSVCQTPCCADAQFVNVNITRLEARAMLQTLRASPKHGPSKVEHVLQRARQAIQQYQLSETGDTFEKTYACPLYEKGIGCLAHWKAKPAPCIQHGCYERWQDIPETVTLYRVERHVRKLNEQVYQGPSEFMTIPVWLVKCAQEEAEEQPAPIPESGD